MLVRGLMHSAGTMCYTLFLIGILLYVFACLSFELITNDMESRSDPAFDSLVEEFFPSIWDSFFTLARFINVDNTTEVLRPLILMNPPLALFFVVVVMVLSVSLMNLVTAIIVEGSLEQATEDRELARTVKVQLWWQ